MERGKGCAMLFSMGFRIENRRWEGSFVCWVLNITKDFHLVIHPLDRWRREFARWRRNFSFWTAKDCINGPDLQQVEER